MLHSGWMVPLTWKLTVSVSAANAGAEASAVAAAAAKRNFFMCFLPQFERTHAAPHPSPIDSDRHHPDGTIRLAPPEVTKCLRANPESGHPQLWGDSHVTFVAISD